MSLAGLNYNTGRKLVKGRRREGRGSKIQMMNSMEATDDFYYVRFGAIVLTLPVEPTEFA